jgi:DNA-binding transcriptional LysR family regulator
MELRHLRYFVAVAEVGHMTRAAAQLGIQQPPLSMQIRALEHELGTQLLHRHPNGVRLSEGGRLLLPQAQRILQEVDALKQQFDGLAKGIKGVLSVGFTSSAAAHAFTPAALRASRSQFPEIELVLSEDNAATLTEAVASYRLHCAILRVPVARPAGLAFETMLTEPSVAAIPTDHPLARGPRAARQVLALSSLDAQPLILVRQPGAPGLYANLLERCAQAGVQPRVVAQVSRMMTNLNLVAAGVGLSVVPTSMQGTHPGAIVYRPLPRDVGLDAPLTLVYRQEDCAGPTATFLNLLREVARRYQLTAAARPGRRRGGGAAASAP